MRMIMRTLAFGALAFTLSSTSIAHAGRGEGGFRKMMEELKLTPEQKEQAKKLHSDGKDGMKAKKEAMKVAHDELEKAIKGSASQDEVRAKFDALVKTQDEFAKARFEQVLGLRGILTPEQRAKLKAPKGGLHKGGRGHGGDDE